MNPFSLPVLGGAALVSAPALWSSVTGQLRLDVGLSRYLVAVVLAWAALSLVAMLVGPAPTPRPADDAVDEAAEAESRPASVS